MRNVFAYEYYEWKPYDKLIQLIHEATHTVPGYRDSGPYNRRVNTNRNGLQFRIHITIYLYTNMARMQSILWEILRKFMKKYEWEYLEWAGMKLKKKWDNLIFEIQYI